jgi:two-component system chemotaxis sensor kinase CheA
VLELIRDPLTHMVRNSGDHGLEDAATRRAAGKSEVGRIMLTAFHEGGHIVIEIADDGRGLDLNRIRAKVLAQGLATQAELDAMPESQLQRFIFNAGFSTAAAVTSVSGRGVGMDVVKTNIEKIGGTIDLKSVMGEGSTFTIKIPLTLAIVSALIVEAAGQRFAIPQLSVVELVHAGTPGAPDTGADADPARERSVIEDLRGTPVLRLRQRLLPLVSLESLLQLEPTSMAGAAPPAARHVVVAQVGAASLGIIVDRVFDTEEIVVKPVAPILRHITMFSGNTILGDGSVIMILDPVGIARATGMGAAPGTESKLRSRRNQAGSPMQSGDAADGAARSDDKVAMLLFHAGGALMAVPLGLVARLEEIPRDRLERHAGGGYQAVTQYRGALMPLVPLSGTLDWERASHPVLVFSDGAPSGGRERCVGLMVDEIVDVVEETLRVELGGQSEGTLGTAVVAGKAAGVLDTRFWLTSVYKGWFDAKPAATQRTPRVLVVEDSSFFRQLLLPVLATAGYAATAASSAAQALRLRDAGAMFEVIVSDIEMPDMNGLEFVAALRAGGPWAELPVIALSGRVTPRDVEVGREAGFTDYIGKFEQESLLASLRQCLEHAPMVRSSVTV